jgi:hypothetical protein
MSTPTKQELDRQLALFKEGERIAAMWKIHPCRLDDISDNIAHAVNWRVSSEAIKDIIKVYQGFLDNGGAIDFTKE